MKGDHRLWFPSEFSTWLLSIDYEDFPGLGHEFLEAIQRKSQDPEEKGKWWEEYKLLLRGCKFEDTTDYHSWLFKSLGKFFKTIPIDQYKVISMGIDEVDCSEPDSYYILVYFICNGKEEKIQEEN